MFYKKQNIKFSYYFYYLIGTMYFYSLKKNIDQILTHFGDALCKK